MTFTITGNATDLDLDTTNLPTVTVQALTSWTAEGGVLRTGEARGVFDAAGALTKDGGGSWVIGAPVDTPMYLKATSLPGVRFPAPADGTTLDLAGLYADHSPTPAPSPLTEYVRGVGVASITDDDLDGTATVTLTDGTTAPLPLPPGPQGVKGDTGATGPQGKPGTTSIAQDPDTGRLYWTGA